MPKKDSGGGLKGYLGLFRKGQGNSLKLLKDNPFHPSLHFKKIGRFWSVRISDHYRALAVKVRRGLHLGMDRDPW